MLLEKERQEVVDYGIKMSTEGLTSGTSGNISAYNKEEGLMAISPSGIGYLDTKVEDIVIMDLKGNIVEGDRKPSSEWGLHASMYLNKADCRGVVHTHSMYCTVFATLRQPLKAVHYVLADSGASVVPCADYATYGTGELAKNAVEAIGEGNAVLLANHGMLACGSSIGSAYGLAKGMEYCAELQYHCMNIGAPVVLSDEQMEVVMDKFKGYGQEDNSGGYYEG